jgi:hypothetical protein
MDQRRARSPIATSSRGGGGLHAPEWALAMGDLTHSVCGWWPQVVALFVENLRRYLAGAELLNGDPPTGTAGRQRWGQRSRSRS